MASDSWAQAVDEQEAAAESIGNLQLKDTPGENGTSIPSAGGTVAKSGDKTSGDKTTDEDESEDKAAQSLLNKLIRSNLVNNTNQVEVLQKDPNSPLYSVKSFEELRL
ncbi:ATP-dependent RNA helicase DDX19B-like isoform X1 [Hippocampus comes]|nr:PREDICTED: ATP-dependent RNA helicase DDX19B-like isoform X1 [Hippocampus comes]